MTLAEIDQLFRTQADSQTIEWTRPKCGTLALTKAAMIVQVLEFPILVTLSCYDGNITFKTKVNGVNKMLYSLYVERYDITHMTMKRVRSKVGETSINGSIYELYRNILTITYTTAVLPADCATAMAPTNDVTADSRGSQITITFGERDGIDLNIVGAVCGLDVFGDTIEHAIATGRRYKVVGSTEEQFRQLSKIRNENVRLIPYDRNRFKLASKVILIRGEPKCVNPGDIYLSYTPNACNIKAHIFGLLITLSMNPTGCRAMVIEESTKLKFNVAWNKGKHSYDCTDSYTRHYEYTGVPGRARDEPFGSNASIIKELTTITNFIISEISNMSNDQ